MHCISTPDGRNVYYYTYIHRQWAALSDMCFCLGCFPCHKSYLLGWIWYLISDTLIMHDHCSNSPFLDSVIQWFYFTVVFYIMTIRGVQQINILYRFKFAAILFPFSCLSHFQISAKLQSYDRTDKVKIIKLLPFSIWASFATTGLVLLRTELLFEV